MKLRTSKHPFRISIAIRLLSYLLLAGIVPLAVMGLSAFDISRRIIVHQAGEFHLQQISDLRAYLGFYADQIESLSANVAGNEEIGQALRAHEDKGAGDSYAALNTHAQIGYVLNGYVRVKGLVSIDLFSVDGKHFHVGDTLDIGDVDLQSVQKMFNEVRASATPVNWRGIEDNLNRTSTQKKVLAVTRAVRHFDPQTGTTEVVGLLVINLDMNVVVSSFLEDARTLEHLNLMLVDRAGRFIYHSDATRIGQQATPGFLDRLKEGQPIQMLRLDGEEVVLAFVPDTRTGGGIIGTLPRSVLTAPINALIYAGMALLVICLAVIGLLAWRFARHVVAPVRDVSRGFSSLQARPEAIPSALPIPTYMDEIADMVLGFNRHLDLLNDQRVAARQLVEARQAAEAANQAKSRFLATMSHEIRTPMNGILGMAQLLLQRQISDAERLEYSRTIFDSGQTLLTLLNDILDLSKVEAGKLTLEMTEFDPARVLRDIQTLFSDVARKKGLVLTAGWKGNAAHRYRGDPHRLSQMLSNLVGNAIKFTAKGSVDVEAREIECAGKVAMIEFSVSDTGLGIPADKLALLFKPFSQADSSTTRQFGGTGLGLSIVRNLAELMGGSAGVESDDGKGSRFWFRIRAEVLESAQTAQPAGDVPVGPDALSVPRRFTGRVLLVDDVRTNRMVAGTMLRKMGLEVVEAEDGAQAVDKVQQGSAFDLVLMDIQMPVMDGYAATQRIRAWEGETGQPPRTIVALTAGAFEEDRQQALDTGMNDFLAKPFSVDALRGLLFRHLVGRQEPEVQADQPSPLLDMDKVEALVVELMPLLAQGKFKSVRKFKELQRLVGGTALEDELAEAVSALANLDFETVFEQLVLVGEAHGRSWRAT